MGGRIHRTILSLAVLLVLGLAGRPSAGDGADPSDRTYAILKEAYVYGFPLVLTEITKGTMTNVALPGRDGRAPVNRISHMHETPGPANRDVVRPNLDTLYSSAFLDLSRGPMVLSLPDTAGRYYLMPILDAWTNVIASPGKRTTGTGPHRFAVAGPDWDGELPQGFELIRSATNTAWLIGRIQADGPEDFPDVRAIQLGIELVPLDMWGKPYVPPAGTVDPGIDMDTPPVEQALGLDGPAFFERFAAAFTPNPPRVVDGAMARELREIGLAPGRGMDAGRLGAEMRTTMRRAAEDARREIAERARSLGESVNGWRIQRKHIGDYGTAYLDRAAVALVGLGANLPSDAIYPAAQSDAQGRPLVGTRSYVLHFEEDELPKVRAFWSLTLYDAQGFLVPNQANRYALGDRSGLRYGEDGSLDLYIQHDPPAGADRSNWLPAPHGAFTLLLRLYWPKREVLTGAWAPPPVERLAP